MRWSKLFRGIRRFWRRRSGRGDAVGSRVENPDYDLFIAQTELDKRHDLSRGAAHLARLLRYDPANREWLELLDRYLQAAGDDPLSLFPEPEPGEHSDGQAIRAAILHRQGRLSEALDLLVAVVSNRLDAAYLEAWALDWLEPPGVVEGLPPSSVLQLLVLAQQRYPEFRYVTAARHRELQRYLAIANRLTSPEGSCEALEATRVELLRKAGCFARAAQAADALVQAQPGWRACLAQALVRREMGDVEAALAALQRALDDDPPNLDVRLAAGDMYLECQQWDQARPWYAGALEVAPEHPWASAALLYCQWKQTGDQQVRDELQQRLVGNDRDPRLQSLQQRLTPYAGYLPEPADASTELLRRLCDRDRVGEGEGGEFLLRLSHLEAPSNRLAFRLMMDSCERHCRLEVHVERIPQPDPRFPSRPVKYLLWTYHGTDPSPAIAAPRGDLARWVGALAAEPYDCEANWASASRLAATLTPRDAPAVLAVMVHPPPLPAGTDVLQWLPRVQLAAAQVLAHLDSGWRHSVRREALCSALWGPADWTNVAAIVALTQLARHYPAAAADICEAFATLAAQVPRSGYCCYEHALYANWLQLPNVAEDQRKSLAERLRQIERREVSGEQPS